MEGKIINRLKQIEKNWNDECSVLYNRQDMDEATKQLILNFYVLQMKSLARMMQATLTSFKADSQRQPAMQYGDAEKAFGEYSSELLKMNLKNILEHELYFIG